MGGRHSLETEIPDRQKCDIMSSLSTRMDNLKVYLGLQNGTQPIALYNGSATITYCTLEGASWRQDRGLAEWMDSIEDIASLPSSPSMCKHMEADEDMAEHLEDIANAIAIACPTNIDSEGRLSGDTPGLQVAMASASTETLPVPMPDGECVAIEGVPMPVPIANG